MILQVVMQSHTNCKQNEDTKESRSKDTYLTPQ